jgi:hypothetical protein
MTMTTELTRDDQQPAAGSDGKIRMTAAMREGLDALEREYAAFVESSFETLSLINDQRRR